MSMVSAIVLSIVAAAPAAGAPLAAGTVTVSAATNGDAGAPDSPAFAAAAGDALGAANFLVMPAGGPSRYHADIVVAREARGLASVQGAGSRVDAMGTGLKMTLPTKKNVLQPLVVTRMTITLTTRRDGRTVWSGSAVTVQADGTRAGDPGVVGAKLAGALLSYYPATLATPLSVP